MIAGVLLEFGATKQTIKQSAAARDIPEEALTRGLEAYARAKEAQDKTPTLYERFQQ